MNLFGSYRKLLDNSRQAMMAAIEIYNKPKFSYREEVFVILLINAWELAFLAILAKNRQRIFEPKKRDQEYRTWRFSESLAKSKHYLPASIDWNAFERNLRLLLEFRNKATHYYNEPQNAHCVYVLSQAAIKNYRDIAFETFGIDLVNEINLVLLPLSFSEQPDFVEFFKAVGKPNHSPLSRELFKQIEELEKTGADTTQFATQCTVKIESTKKISTADFVVGLDTSVSDGKVILSPPRDPNKSHPFSSKEIIAKLKSDGLKMHPNMFNAVCRDQGLRGDEKKHKYAWRSSRKASPWCYTSEVLKAFRELGQNGIEEAYQRQLSKNRKTP